MNKFIPKIEVTFGFSRIHNWLFNFGINYTGRNVIYVKSGRMLDMNIDIYYISFVLIFFWEQGAQNE